MTLLTLSSPLSSAILMWLHSGRSVAILRGNQPRQDISAADLAVSVHGYVDTCQRSVRQHAHTALRLLGLGNFIFLPLALVIGRCVGTPCTIHPY
jgi:hypothetical protein